MYFTLVFVIFPHGNQWVAQCVDFHVAPIYAATLDTMVDNIAKTVEEQIAQHKLTRRQRRENDDIPWNYQYGDALCRNNDLASLTFFDDSLMENYFFEYHPKAAKGVKITDKATGKSYWATNPECFFACHSEMEADMGFILFNNILNPIAMLDVAGVSMTMPCQL